MRLSWKLFQREINDFFLSKFQEEYNCEDFLNCFTGHSFYEFFLSEKEDNFLILSCGHSPIRKSVLISRKKGIFNIRT